MTRRRGEGGYALVAAVASMAVFAAMALTVLSATSGAIEDASAEQAQLQVAAAADAGLAIAISRLTSQGADRWVIGGPPRQLRFGEARLTVRIEDERGKVPISRLDPALATRLLEEVGLSGERLLIARDSLLDWTDDDDLARPYGAEDAYYQAAGIVPSNGYLASLEELHNIRGFDADTVARLAPLVTTYTAMATFDAQYADPRALAIMEAGGEDSPVSIERAREQAGQRTAIAFGAAADNFGRPLTIAIDAVLPDGARARRRTVVELSDAGDRPYRIRASD